MRPIQSTRRQFLQAVGATAAALNLPSVHADGAPDAIVIDPKPRFALSPYLYMQFMEPLGTTDGSVAAAWDFGRDCWREDVIDVTRRLAPSMMRWGGCFSSYYRWKEAVGPRDKRIPMLNMCWGGLDTNQIGTVEFVDFCRQVEAEPLMCVNFESDGRAYWQKDPKGGSRMAGPEEAAAWVRYCNDPDDRLRRSHGTVRPCPIRMWQIGNETSYDRNGYDCETAAKRTIAFAKAMRQADPNLTLIGWGDSGWAKRMLDIAGEHLQYIAFHHMFNPDQGQADSPLRDTEYRKDPARTWEHLMNACKTHEARIRWMREQVGDDPTPLALTECHFALPGRNRCEVLSSWAAGVSNARLLNVHERHGDRLKIATLADFCGTRWQVNAIMIPVPGGQSFMMPVARVMSLYRHHSGDEAVDVTRTPDGLDITASRRADKLFLHVVNTNRRRSVATQIAIAGMQIASGRVFELTGDPEHEIIRAEPNGVVLSEKALPQDGRWSFPAASVSAVELDVRTA
ncbi:alpha-L-arabinofuranosidase C-terminal domain-containing protein [Anaerobaca lacustris]|uniref:non-reducing end alpha-L-arabinofuranosidase n=1 Tax=Anaerobaca lacustris TaxID=3044600 RepID=A0AAW6TYK5_9BACT|nr:alpha-L-arabinofuranosidase C-terminal domain-containing protein [Sedimentisphaerales bacterium M17dextr]